MIYFITPWDQHWIIENIRQRLPKCISEQIMAVSYHELYSVQFYSNSTYIFTGLGVITGVQREAGTVLWNQLNENASECRLFNHPENSLNRYELLKNLYEAGMNQFRVFRALEFQKSTCSFPVFVREARRHTGSLTGLLYDLESVKDAIQSLKKSGYSANDLLVVEFLNCADQNGLYKKYSALKIGDDVIPRYLSLGCDWVVKENEPDPASGTLYTKELLEEEAYYIRENPHQEEIKTIFSIANIEYGRIDYALKDGVIQTWEINTLPSFGSEPWLKNKAALHERKQARAPAKEYFYDSFTKSVNHLLGDKFAAPVQVDFPGELVTQLTWENRKQKCIHKLVKLGQRIPRIPFTTSLRATLKKRIRAIIKSGPKL